MPRKAAGIKWAGLENVVNNLNDEIAKIEGVTVDGLLEAALFIKEKSQRDTPVDTSNLKASAYVIWGGGKKRAKVQTEVPAFKKVNSKIDIETQHREVLNERNKPHAEPFAEVGYTAHYAAPVHEGVNKNFRVGQAKFLEKAFVQHGKTVLEIIKRRIL